MVRLSNLIRVLLITPFLTSAGCISAQDARYPTMGYYEDPDWRPYYIASDGYLHSVGGRLDVAPPGSITCTSNFADQLEPGTPCYIAADKARAC